VSEDPLAELEAVQQEVEALRRSLHHAEHRLAHAVAAAWKSGVPLSVIARRIGRSRQRAHQLAAAILQPGSPSARASHLRRRSA
jgi:hypothetical protein